MSYRLYSCDTRGMLGQWELFWVLWRHPILWTPCCWPEGGCRDASNGATEGRALFCMEFFADQVAQHVYHSGWWAMYGGWLTRSYLPLEDWKEMGKSPKNTGGRMKQSSAVKISSNWWGPWVISTYNWGHQVQWITTVLASVMGFSPPCSLMAQLTKARFFGIYGLSLMSLWP